MKGEQGSTHLTTESRNRERTTYEFFYEKKIQKFFSLSIWGICGRVWAHEANL